ncbi:MAG: hypothetical protein ACI9NQ_000807 [Paracoccaceae bacterium]|jgi:hypothetical protein
MRKERYETRERESFVPEEIRRGALSLGLRWLGKA